MSEAETIARITWFAGLLLLLIGFLINSQSLMIAAGLAINGGVIAVALVARAREY